MHKVQYGPKGVMPRNEGSFSVMDAWLCGYCGYRLPVLPVPARLEAHSDLLAAKKQRREDTRQRSKGAKIVANCLEVVEAVLVVTEVKIG